MSFQPWPKNSKSDLVTNFWLEENGSESRAWESISTMTQRYTVPGTRAINLDPVSHLRMNFVFTGRPQKNIVWDR